MLALSHAGKLQDSLDWATRRSGQNMISTCVVCNKPINNAKDHLTSDEHLNVLRTRIPTVAGPAYEIGNPSHTGSEVCAQAPWVQDFGNGVKFNHLTMQTFDD